MKLVSDRYVPHRGPENAKIMFIGDCPLSSDTTTLQTFSGSAGELLEYSLQSLGQNPEDFRYGNLLNYQPHKFDVKNANTSWQLEESRNYLREYLQQHHHTVLVPMGSYALDFLTSMDRLEKRRGSVYTFGKSFVVPSYHPSDIQQDGTNSPAFFHDLEKALHIAEHGWTEPKFNFILNPDIYQIEGLLPVLTSSSRLACDIETKMYGTYIRCMGFAWSPTDAVCVFNDSQEGIGPNFGRFLRTVLSSDVPKIFHNGMFDTFILEENGIETNAWIADTMLTQHALQPELPKGLDYCTSMYTNINYYKDDGKESSERIDKTRLAIYNCKDVVATFQVHDAQEKELDAETKRIADFSLAQVPMAKHISRAGMLVDEERRGVLRDVVNSRLSESYTMFMGAQLMYGVEPFKASQHAKVQSFLYDTLGLPVKTKKGGGITSDEDAIVSLIGTVQKKLDDLKSEKSIQEWSIKLACLRSLLSIRGYEKLMSSYVNVDCSLDGRVRSWYKITGTETGRWSAGMWHDNTGLNAQTIPREAL